MLRTKDDFVKALSKMKPNLYCGGQLIDRVADQPECIGTIALSYDEAQKPENEGLMTATSHLTGKKISRFTHIHQNREDLHRKQDMTRMLCQKIGACIERYMGIDAANALYNVTYEADKQNKGATQYHDNFKKWLLRFQEGDLIAACGQTDVKGDRMLRPAEQPNPSACHSIYRVCFSASTSVGSFVTRDGQVCRGPVKVLRTLFVTARGALRIL